MKLFLICLILFLSGCTYSVNLIHSSGSASDMIDETQSPKADVSVPITVPSAPL